MSAPYDGPDRRSGPTTEEHLLGIVDTMVRAQNEGFDRLERSVGRLGNRMLALGLLLILACAAPTVARLVVSISHEGISWSSEATAATE